jgi:hypothetical protein
MSTLRYPWSSRVNPDNMQHTSHIIIININGIIDGASSVIRAAAG